MKNYFKDLTPRINRKSISWKDGTSTIWKLWWLNGQIIFSHQGQGSRLGKVYNIPKTLPVEKIEKRLNQEIPSWLRSKIILTLSKLLFSEEQNVFSDFVETLTRKDLEELQVLIDKKLETL